MNEQWQKVTHRIERQSLLRLLSCIQLASKVTDRNKVKFNVKLTDQFEYNL
jgi:hypothetical protein